MRAFEQAWSLLKAIRTSGNPNVEYDSRGKPQYKRGYSGHISEEGGAVPDDPGKKAAHFRESLPNFPLAGYIQTDDAGRPISPSRGRNNKSFNYLIPDITRQSNYQYAPKFDQYGTRVHNANYQTGEPRTHYPDKDSPQRFIDDLVKPIKYSEEYMRQQSYPFQGTRQATHPTQKELDEFDYGISLDEFRERMDSQLPRLGYDARHSYDMNTPEGRESIFETNREAGIRQFGP